MDDYHRRKALAKMLPEVRNYRAFRKDVSDAVLWLSNTIYETKRKDPADTRQRLKKLSKLLTDATTAISELGYDARWKLDSVTGVEIRHEEARKGAEEAPTSISKEPYHTRGRKVVADLANGVAHLADLAGNAALGIRPPGKGRPPAGAYREAVRSLMEVWIEQTGNRPTLTTLPSGRKQGVSLNFCREVINPVYEAHGLNPPDGERAVRDVLAIDED
ncbi:MAG: hypothetical protein AAFR79_15060 [Pseudomonadota bacterium]